MIGISGDSGSGKDTLARGTGALFGCEQTTQLSGDDYHLAERHDPLWERMTHLDPAANDLARLAADVAALAPNNAWTMASARPSRAAKTYPCDRTITAPVDSGPCGTTHLDPS